MRRFSVLFLITLIMLLLALQSSQTAYGATISVTITTDEMTNNTTCSLREAIIAANTNSNAHENACIAGQVGVMDVITLENGATYLLDIAGSGEDAAQTGDLDILNNTAATDLTINVSGGGSASITQNSSPGDRVLHILNGATAEIIGVTISGGSSIADGGGIVNAGTLTLNNSEITNNSATGNGGGVHNTGTLTVDASTISANNTMPNGMGGGIYNSNGTVIIQNGSVIGGEGAGNAAASGGGIYSDGTMTIDASTVSANTATNAGGGIQALSTLNILNGSVIGGIGVGNSAQNGGGIYISSGTTTLDASLISANTAITDGGGIYNAATLNIQNSSQIGEAGAGNSAVNGGGVFTLSMLTVDASAISANIASVSGGGIYNSSGTVTIQNTSVIGGAGTGNTAAGDGGGIDNTGTLTVDDSTFSANTSGGHGGGINHQSGTATIQNNSVIGEMDAGNMAVNGGGIFTSDTLNVSASAINANTASGSGGGLHIDSATTTLITTRVRANTANGNGGGIYNGINGALVMTGGALLTNYTPFGTGGALYNDMNLANAVSITGSCIVGNDEIALYNNTAASQNAAGNWWGETDGPNPTGSGDSVGGTWDTTGFLTSPPAECGDLSIRVNTTVDDYNTDGDCSLREAIIAANTNAPIDGCLPGSNSLTDTIWLTNGLTYSLTISGSGEDQAALGDLDILDNTIPLDLIIAVENHVNVTSIWQNASPDDRVLHILAGAEVEINQVTITRGGGVPNGGGIYNEGTLTLDGSIVSYNAATNNGGGIHNTGTLTLQNNTDVGGVYGGSSAENGGGIYNEGILTIDRSIFTDNKATLMGGGIYNAATLILENGSNLSGNKALEGGGIYNTGTLTVNAAFVINNQVGHFGGGIYNAPTGATLIQNGARIGSGGMGNRAGHGGGIYNEGTVMVEDAEIHENSAFYSGGGIYNLSGTVTLDNTVVSRNTANEKGGGIYNNAQLIIQNGSAVGGVGAGNRAAYGGGIYNYGGTVTVSASIVSANLVDLVPTSSGGGIYNEATLIIQNNSVIGGAGAGNSAPPGHGGGIYNSDGTTTIENSTLSHNGAGGSGGGIANAVGTVTVDASIISSNGATGGGGIWNNDTLIIQNGSVIGGAGAGNIGGAFGGGLDLVAGTTTITDSTVSANSAHPTVGRGGGIYNTGTLTIQNSTIGGAGAGNSASSGGGISNGDGGILIVSASTVSANAGGGINNTGTATIQNNSVIGGVGAGNSGSGIYSTGTLTLDHSTVSANIGGGYAGGVYNSGTLIIQNGSVIGGPGAGNTAANAAGIWNAGGSATISASTVSANIAFSGVGGGIYNSGGATLMIQNNSVIGGAGAGNSAPYGGGLANGNGTVTVDASIVSANSGSDGGGILNSSTLYIQNGSVIGGPGTGNSAGNGGGIYNNLGIVTITNSIISYNTATGNGDAVFNDLTDANAVNITGSCITANGSIAVYNQDSDQQLAAGNWWGVPTGPNTSGADTTGGNWDTSGYLTSSPANCQLGAPTNLVASPISKTQIDLTWTDHSSDETSFKIERSLDGSTGWMEIGTNSADDTTYSDTGLACYTMYYYRIRAYRSGGGQYSGYTSPIASTRTLACGNGIFADVPVAGKAWMQEWIEAFYNTGITSGCGASPLIYCPEREVTRAEMAVFTIRALHYPNLPYTPTDPDDHFADVPAAGKEWMRPWIEEFYDLGITQGCGVNPLIFCPEQSVTRAEMAVFILRALEGGSYQPPAASGYFDDVPVAGKAWMEPWIDEFYRRGITTGCEANPLRYCPERPVTRAEMAVFILRAFESIPNP